MKPIAVLGVGPAGLMAAHAVALSGRPVSLFGQPNADGSVKKSKLGGAQFLHDPIPIVCDEEDPDAVITYRVFGTVERYAQKVYGGLVKPERVSMNNVYDGKQVNAWNLLSTYDKLWDYLSAKDANVVTIDQEWIAKAIEAQWFDMILSTIPAPAICVANYAHSFPSQSITIANEAMMGTPDTIYYSGHEDHSWYRTSVLFGYEGTEWGQGVTPPLPGTFKVAKPLQTNCNCHPEVERLGRYGTWTKGVLTTHAFTGALKLVMA